MVASDVDDDWVANTLPSMDVIEETTTKPGVPNPPGSEDYILYIPDFVPEHVHDDTTKAEMLAAHD
jgi:hypothetical protein